MEYGIYVGLGTAVAILVHAVRATWKLSRVEKELRDYFDAQVDNLQLDVAKLERSGTERAETLRHEFGETGTALRTKIHEVETWSRDTFVRKDSFETAISRIEKTTENAVNKIDKRLDSMFEWFKQNNR
jgi:hypothetical protein